MLVARTHRGLGYPGGRLRLLASPLFVVVDAEASPADLIPQRDRPALRQRATAQAARGVSALLLVVAGLAAAALLAVNVGPRVLPYQTATVLTGSMAPAIPVGSLVVMRPVQPSELNVGDVITFLRPDNGRQLITHRIVQVDAASDGSRAFATRGDANAVADPWHVIGTGSGWRVVWVVPHLGSIFTASRNPLSGLLLRVLPALVLGAVLLGEIWRPVVSVNRASRSLLNPEPR